MDSINVCVAGLLLMLGRCCCCYGNVDEIQLYDKLVTKHISHKYIRPVDKPSDCVQVDISLALIGLEDLDESRQVMTSHIYLRQKWQNPNMTWDPEAYNGITSLYVPVDQIWTPDIVPHNSLSESFNTHHDSMAVVDYTGLTLWITQSRLETFCYMDLTNFPLDQHTCPIKVGSWVYDVGKVNISHWGEPELDLSYGSAHHNSEWMIQNVSVVRHTQLYGCCPEPYVDITGYVTLSRRHSYVIQVYVAPAVTFILLTPAVFMLPPESSHKFILGIGLLLSQVLLLSSVQDVLPRAHHKPPRLCIYYLSTLVMVSLSLGISALVANLWNRSKRRSYGVPGCVRVMLLKGLGRLLCLHYEDFLCTDTSHDHEHTNYDHYTTSLDNLSQSSSNNPLDGATMIREYNSHVVHRAEWRQLSAIVDRTFCIIFCVLSVLISVAIVVQF